MKIGVLTGGSDKPYVLGLVPALTDRDIDVDVVASDELVCDELLGDSKVTFLNLRGDTSADAGKAVKVARIAKYYLSLLSYASRQQPTILHILWANRFPLIDHVLINVFYKIMGKKLAFTAHNVNQRARDGSDSAYNRFTLGMLYRLVDYIFVHTEGMKTELLRDFGVDAAKVGVIPFGINNTLPNTDTTGLEARARLMVGADEKVLLFFGRIAPYKGLELAIESLARLAANGDAVRLVIAGRVEQGCDPYWQEVVQKIEQLGLQDQVTRIIEFIPDEDVELYFKAADALVMPYRAIFQSGVVFLSYSFGLPVIASDVGSFRDDIVQGKTGMICRADDVADLAETIRKYFGGELYRGLPTAREEIAAYGNRKYSWVEVGNITCAAYEGLIGRAQVSACK